MELSHTLEVRPNLFIRAFIRFYDLSYPYDLNTCKLFWGALGMVILPIIGIVLSPIILLVVGLTWFGRKVDQTRTDRRMAYMQFSLEERRQLEAEASEKWRSKLLGKLSEWGGAIWFKVQTPVTWFFRILVGLLALAAVVAIVILATNVLPGLQWGEILPVAAVAFGVGAGVAVLLVGGGILIQKLAARPARPEKPSVIKAVFRSIHDHTCANIKVTE